MTVQDATPVAETLPTSKALKQATQDAHEKVDAAMMALSPFADLEGYRRYLGVQYRFHRAAAPLYRHPDLQAWLPELAGRCRYADVIADCRDLGLDIAALASLPDAALTSVAVPYEALGWLYTTEGSNLGAAILYKLANGLGLTASHGARHLAERGDGRARYWREFVAQLDAIALTDAQREQVLSGGRNAFAHVQALATTSR